MYLVNVLFSNGYVSLAKNKDLLFEKLAPSKIVERKIALDDDGVSLLKKQKIVELGQFDFIEVIPNFPKQSQVDTFVEYELEIDPKQIKEIA